MKLLLNDTSPFARFSLITALECEIENLDLTWTNPWVSPEELISKNPFSTIPTLVLDDNSVIYESLLIASYFISQIKNPKKVIAILDYNDTSSLERLAFSKNLMELSFRIVILEKFFNKEIKCSDLIKRSHDNLNYALKKISPLFSSHLKHRVEVDLSVLCLIVALDYINFRLPNFFDYTEKAIQVWLKEMHLRESIYHCSLEKLKKNPRNLNELLQD